MNPTNPASPRLDLLRFPAVRWLLTNRWPQFLARLLTLAGFLFAIYAGLFGTPVGSHNFSIVFVWILWWAFLILLAVPFLGRGWCSICPIPLPGEWLQQGALLAPPASHGPLARFWPRAGSRRWPRRLRNIWLQNAGFLLLALFSAVVLTLPKATALVLAAFLLLAFGTSLIYERRAFCRYLCPVGGFIGLYAQAAPLEIRVRDTAVCVAHTEKTCYTGNAQGYGCPWGVFPGALAKNTACGVCLECLRACPQDNLALNLRPFGADLTRPGGRKLDEAFKSFIMLGSAFVYSAVMLGPWGALKTAAFAVGSAGWWGYAAATLGFTLLGLPGFFSLAVRLGQRLSGDPRSLRQGFVNLSYALVPLGLAAWAAFTLSFVFANLSYLWPVASDPLGWGWDLLGTAGVGWQPYFSGAVPALQTAVLTGGLAWTSATARRLAAESPALAPLRLAAPVIGFAFCLTAGFLWLLVG